MAGTDLTPYVNKVKAAGLPYRFYGGGFAVFFYFYWPNGWGIQLIGSYTTAPAGGGYGFCTQGLKGTCRTDLKLCQDKCTNALCGDFCPNLIKKYDCGTYYCPSCQWAG